MIFSGPRSYYDEYVRKSGTQRILSDSSSLLTDRGAYVNFLETQLERVSAACLGVQAYEGRFDDMQNLIVALEQRCGTTTKLLSLVQQSTEEIRHDTIDRGERVGAEARAYNKEAQATLEAFGSRLAALELTVAHLPAIEGRIGIAESRISSSEAAAHLLSRRLDEQSQLFGGQVATAIHRIDELASRLESESSFTSRNRAEIDAHTSSYALQLQQLEARMEEALKKDRDGVNALRSTLASEIQRVMVIVTNSNEALTKSLKEQKDQWVQSTLTQTQEQNSLISQYVSEEISTLADSFSVELNALKKELQKEREKRQNIVQAAENIALSEKRTIDAAARSLEAAKTPLQAPTPDPDELKKTIASEAAKAVAEANREFLKDLMDKGIIGSDQPKRKIQTSFIPPQQTPHRSESPRGRQVVGFSSPSPSLSLAEPAQATSTFFGGGGVDGSPIGPLRSESSNRRRISRSHEVGDLSQSSERPPYTTRENSPLKSATLVRENSAGASDIQTQVVKEALETSIKGTLNNFLETYKLEQTEVTDRLEAILQRVAPTVQTETESSNTQITSDAETTRLKDALSNSPGSVESNASSCDSALSRSLDEFFPLQASLRRYSKGTSKNATSSPRSKSQSPMRDRSEILDREATLLSRYSNWIETADSTINSDDFKSFEAISAAGIGDKTDRPRKSSSPEKKQQNVVGSQGSYISLKARNRYLAEMAPTVRHPWLPIKSIKQFTSRQCPVTKPYMQRRSLSATAATMKARLGGKSAHTVGIQTSICSDSEGVSLASSGRQRTLSSASASTSSNTDSDKKDAFSSLRSARENAALHVVGSCKNHLSGAGATVKEDASTWTATSELRSHS